MKSNSLGKILALTIFLGTLAGCGEPRAVMLPLEYPDGSAVTNMRGEPVMAGFQTYGSAMHANATAIYESARSPKCATCARVGAVVSEPSTFRQATGFIGTGAVGAGTVMGGIGAMDYGDAAHDGKLRSNVSTNVSNDSSSSSQASAGASAAASAAAASNAAGYGGQGGNMNYYKPHHH